MRNFRPQIFLGSFIFILAAFIGCSQSINPNIERGSGYNFKEGYPEVRFSALGLINQQGTPQIDIAADIVYGSLIFNEENDSLASKIAIDVQVLPKDESERIVNSKRYVLDIRKNDQNIVYSQDVFTFQKSLNVSPGEYKINFTLTDLNSKKRITSTAETFIPDPEANLTNLTNIKLLGKNLSNDIAEWSPITTYDIPGRVDSLKFIFQVTNNNSEEPLVVNSKLLRFRSDTSFARAMHENSYSSSSISYKGIDYGKSTTIQSNQRKLIQQGNVLIEFKFEQQERGNYRFEVQTNKSKDDDKLYKARDFGVKSENYPSLKSATELARPMVYLMDDNEYQDLLNINNPDSLKEAIDRFWLKNIGNKNKAKKVIAKYFQRVEEANKQFSNFQEGWKTDPGMMYILFGSPWYIDQTLDRMQWSYAYDRSDPERNFLFHQPKFESALFPFNHFLLQRSQSYFTVQYQQVELWLSGLILQRNI